MMKLTIYDIAKALDLAPSTISKVINNKGSASEATRKRVLEYIKEVGYVPSNSARMLKSSNSYTIGIVFTEELNIGLEHSFFSSILQHFKTEVEKEGYELSFIVTRMGKNKQSYYEWAINKKVDGIYIVTGDYNDQGILELAEKNIPVVSTDIFMKGIKTTISDNIQGIQLSLDYLFNEQKLKTVGLIAGPLQSKAFQIRYDAYLNYFKEHNHEVISSYIVEAESFGFTSGYQAATNLIINNEKLPEGLLVGSDDIALGVLRAFKDNNISVPNDIQIIGFDDIQYAKHFTPNLTTIRQNRALMGQTAAKNLIEMIRDKEADIEDLTLIPVELIKRETTK